MFDVGFPELVLVAVIGLLVLGPQRLPKVAAEIGKWVGRARRTASQLRRQLEREIELEDVERLRTRSAPPPESTPAPPDAESRPPESHHDGGAAASAEPPPAAEPASSETADKPTQS
jgi:sec-independent protein translocase protein TatB